jgi:hypothetical protein
LGFRFSSRGVWASGALATLALLAGCGGSGASSGSIPASESGAMRSSHFGAAFSRVKHDTFIDWLYVANQQGGVFVLDSNYNWIQSPVGFSAQCPSGAWISRYGPKKLYLANFGCVGPPYVTEAHQLSNGFGVEQFHYTTSLIDPLFVTSNLPTMSVPQVYVGDFFGKQVVQYAELSNAIVHQCSSNAFIAGVAADNSGDVFVSQLGGSILKYPGPAGLGNCAAGTPIGGTVASGGELLLDNSNNLIECAQNGAVYTIAGPAYNSPVQIPTTASFKCLHMSLNRAGNRLFITEPFLSPPDIQVLKYPSGVVTTTIVPAPSNHNFNPVGVAAYPG